MSTENFSLVANQMPVLSTTINSTTSFLQQSTTKILNGCCNSNQETNGLKADSKSVQFSDLRNELLTRTKSFSPNEDVTSLNLQNAGSIKLTSPDINDTSISNNVTCKLNEDISTYEKCSSNGMEKTNALRCESGITPANSNGIRNINSFAPVMNSSHSIPGIFHVQGSHPISTYPQSIPSYPHSVSTYPHSIPTYLPNMIDPNKTFIVTNPPQLAAPTPMSIPTPRLPTPRHKALDRSLSEPVPQLAGLLLAAGLVGSARGVSDQANDSTGLQLSLRAAANLCRYKSELCRPFEEHGQCKYGDKCQFAHGRHELRSMIRHPKYKTDLCKTYHTTGLCPYGPRCHFIHNDEERKLSELNRQLIDQQRAKLIQLQQRQQQQLQLSLQIRELQRRLSLADALAAFNRLSTAAAATVPDPTGFVTPKTGSTYILPDQTGSVPQQTSSILLNQTGSVVPAQIGSILAEQTGSAVVNHDVSAIPDQSSIIAGQNRRHYVGVSPQPETVPNFEALVDFDNSTRLHLQEQREGCASSTFSKNHLSEKETAVGFTFPTEDSIDLSVNSGNRVFERNGITSGQNEPFLANSFNDPPSASTNQLSPIRKSSTENRWNYQNMNLGHRCNFSGYHLNMCTQTTANKGFVTESDAILVDNELENVQLSAFTSNNVKEHNADLGRKFFEKLSDKDFGIVISLANESNEQIMRNNAAMSLLARKLQSHQLSTSEIDSLISSFACPPASNTNTGTSSSVSSTSASSTSLSSSCISPTSLYTTCISSMETLSLSSSSNIRPSTDSPIEDNAAWTWNGFPYETQSMSGVENMEGWLKRLTPTSNDSGFNSAPGTSSKCSTQRTSI